MAECFVGVVVGVGERLGDGDGVAVGLGVSVRVTDAEYDMEFETDAKSLVTDSVREGETREIDFVSEGSSVSVEDNDGDVDTDGVADAVAVARGERVAESLRLCSCDALWLSDVSGVIEKVEDSEGLADGETDGVCDAVGELDSEMSTVGLDDVVGDTLASSVAETFDRLAEAVRDAFDFVLLTLRLRVVERSVSVALAEADCDFRLLDACCDTESETDPLRCCVGDQPVKDGVGLAVSEGVVVRVGVGGGVIVPESDVSLLCVGSVTVTLREGEGVAVGAGDGDSLTVGEKRERVAEGEGDDDSANVGENDADGNSMEVVEERVGDGGGVFVSVHEKVSDSDDVSCFDELARECEVEVVSDGVSESTSDAENVGIGVGVRVAVMVSGTTGVAVGESVTLRDGDRDSDGKSLSDPDDESVVL